MPKNVLLITSTNLACNPRCLKEARLLNSMGNDVTVVAFNLHNWTDEKENEINNELNSVKFHYLESTRVNLFPWLIASLLQKLCMFLSRYFSSNILIQSIAISKRSWQLLRWLKKFNKKFDLIIAHNPPAFYPASVFAAQTKTAFAIDVEDYHPGEGNGKQQKSIEILMKSILPLAKYISYASPLIKKYTDDLIQPNNQLQEIIINNTFSSQEFLAPDDHNSFSKKIRLVWFSQFIDYGRGLEKILPVLDKYADEITLTLIGSKRDIFFTQEIETRKYINCLSSLSQMDLNKELKNYDIGLALEDKEADFNRNICLTNKIWAYFLAGLYIIASDTDAQVLFLDEHAGHGLCTSLSEITFTKTIKEILETKERIRANAIQRFEYAKAYNWENESVILLNIWKKLLR